MSKQVKLSSPQLSARFIQTVCHRLSENKQVRRTLPERGRLHIDRQLPFLCLYRRPPGREDVGTERLVMGQASYLVASGSKHHREPLSKLIQNIVKTLAPEFGAFLILEIWAGQEQETTDDTEHLPRHPEFCIVKHPNRSPLRTVETLKRALEQTRVRKLNATVEVIQGRKTLRAAPPSLLPVSVLRELGCSVVGLEVRPIYRSPETGEVFPAVRQALLHQLTRALHRAFFEFSRAQTTHRPAHFHVLGRRAVVKAVWEADRCLAEISSAFDFLLQVTPVDSESAYASFKRSRSERTPVFHYRPQAVDVAQLKRRLWNVRIERIEDATLGHLFREKQHELDIRLTMLANMDTPAFLYGGLQLFGKVDDCLMRLAEALLLQIPPRSREKASGHRLNATAFAARVEEELAYYRHQYPQLSAAVEIRDDIYSGLMVSRGNLLVGKSTNIPASRVEALIQHEVGTHIVTYFNGLAQPFRMLYTGLAGYEEMQEGLAVLAEYLAGGLSLPRLRVLAARVVAARCLTEGASFTETFRILTQQYRFSQRAAFTITMRVYRGGGLTKDAVYLRGLVHLLDYLKTRRTLEPLFVGKIAAEHIPIIQELQWRKVLVPAPLRPRYMDNPNIEEKLARLRQGMSVLELAEQTRKAHGKRGV